MERDFYKELNENKLYRFLLRNNGCKVYWLSQSEDGEVCATFTSNSSSVYFNWSNGTYRRVDMSTETCRDYNSKNLLDDIQKFTRIEKKIEDKWVPVWTFVDGFIDTDHEKFIYINERYYTFKELAQIIDEVKSIKKAVANLKVY